MYKKHFILLTAKDYCLELSFSNEVFMLSYKIGKICVVEKTRSQGNYCCKQKIKEIWYWIFLFWENKTKLLKGLNTTKTMSMVFLSSVSRLWTLITKTRMGNPLKLATGRSLQNSSKILIYSYIYFDVCWEVKMR